MYLAGSETPFTSFDGVEEASARSARVVQVNRMFELSSTRGTTAPGSRAHPRTDVPTGTSDAT